MFYWRSRRAERIRPMRGVSSAVGAGPRPARRVPLPFPSALRRGGPCGRPPQHIPRPLGMCPRTGCDPNIARWRSRGQSRNRGRTLCAPTKNVIRCGGRNISAPPKTWFQYRGRIISAPTKKRKSGVGNDSCPPHEKRKPDIVGGAYPHGPRRFVRRRGRSQTGPSGSAPLHGSPP